MKLSEKALLDGYDGLTNGGDYISIVRKERIYWNYRGGSDGYFNPVCDREKAAEISLSYDRQGAISMHSKWDNHRSVSKIKQDEARLWGDEI